MPNHIVLAYSGGLDTSVAVHWLAKQHDAKLTAVLVDLGQDPDDLQEARARALQNGAEDCVIVPAGEAFATRHITPALRANAVYQGVYPLATALARPLIAQALVDVAHQVGADAIAHGCTGKGNDQVRIETAVKALDPALQVLAPQRTHPMDRPSAIAYAKAHALALPVVQGGTYSVDENLWGRSVEGDHLEDPWHRVPEDAYAWTVGPAEAAAPQDVVIGFEQGLPVSLDGLPLALRSLIAQLNDLAGAHGIGRIDHVEDRLVGIKSREVYEAPAAAVLLTAKKALEALTLTKQELALRPLLEQQYAQLVYDGLWHSPLRTCLDAFFEASTKHVTGDVRVRLDHGQAIVTGRRASASLLDAGLATYGQDDAFDHQAATGFIHIWSLPLQTVAGRAALLASDDAPGEQGTAARAPTVVAPGAGEAG